LGWSLGDTPGKVPDLDARGIELNALVSPGKALEEISSLALACRVGYFECGINEQLKIPVQRKAGNEKSF